MAMVLSLLSAEKVMPQRFYLKPWLKLEITASKKALVTVEKSNTASINVIKKNNGIFDSEGAVEDIEGIFQRYWIEIDKHPC